MNYNVYKIDGNKLTEHIAGFSNSHYANTWAENIQRERYPKLFLLVVEGEINKTLVPLKEEEKKK